MGPGSVLLSSGQLHAIVWGGLAAVTILLVLTFFIFFCSSCDGEKRPKHQNGDHENLMNVPSDKEVFSHSITSLATEPPASSEQNGLLSNGDGVRKMPCCFLKQTDEDEACSGIAFVSGRSFSKEMVK